MTLDTWNRSDIWSEWCLDKTKDKKQKDKKTKRQEDKKSNEVKGQKDNSVLLCQGDFLKLKVVCRANCMIIAQSWKLKRIMELWWMPTFFKSWQQFVVFCFILRETHFIKTLEHKHNGSPFIFSQVYKLKFCRFVCTSSLQHFQYRVFKSELCQTPHIIHHWTSAMTKTHTQWQIQRPGSCIFWNF